MTLRVVGAGLPRTGTDSLRQALQYLVGGRCLHMREIDNHPFDLGPDWQRALAGHPVPWEQVLDQFTAAVDWPASMFWHEISETYPDAPVLLSVRRSAREWYESANRTILVLARMALAPDWNAGRDLVTLLERFTGTADWDDPPALMAAYERHNAMVRQTIPSHRLLEWHAPEGWAPLCHALGLPVPDVPFPWTNKRENWE